jgi:hypothetical protein
MSEGEKPPAHPVLEDISLAVEKAIERLDARDKAAEAHEKEKSSRKDALSSRVSIAAIALTMLMSFLGFARTERDEASKAARLEAQNAKRDTEANWTLYQTRTTERAGYATADDTLVRDASAITDGDPRLRLAELNHVEYQQRITQIDNESRQVFFVIEALQKKQIEAERRTAHIERKIDRYDMGTRVLTLALVILSVTLLANQERLFWIGVGLAFIGASIAVSGYFLV